MKLIGTKRRTMDNKTSKRLIKDTVKEFNYIDLQNSAAIENILREFRAQVEEETLEEAAKKFEKMKVYKDIREAVAEDLRKMAENVKF